MDDSTLGQALESDIAFAHERFVAAMRERVKRMTPAQRERYFAVLSLLVAKLEDPDRELRSVIAEMMAEAGSYLMAELAGDS